MTENNDAVFELKEQLNDVYQAYDALEELICSVSSGMSTPDISPLIRLINQRFEAILLGKA